MYKRIDFKVRDNYGGKLIALEQMKEIPFDIKRIYYLFGNDGEIRRGFHAHKKLQQMFICMSGSCKMLLDDGKNKETVVFDSNCYGVLLEGVVWREIFDFSGDCVLMVVADEYYDEADYIRDYGEFLRIF